MLMRFDGKRNYLLSFEDFLTYFTREYDISSLEALYYFSYLNKMHRRSQSASTLIDSNSKLPTIQVNAGEVTVS